MPIEMPKAIPFSVDTWNESSKRSKRHHFLTHAHKDHSSGILSHSSFPIFSSSLTKSLLLQQFPQLDDGGDIDSVFIGIEAGQSILVDDPDGSFTVTAFDANHCPGALMFLFEGNFGNILHTGDCRLTPECLRNLPEKYMGTRGKKPRCSLDYVFLDCTFGSFYRPMPSKHVAIQQVMNCIWKHPDAEVVYLTCDLLGQEEILSAVSKTFGSKIFIDRASNPECFNTLTLLVPEIISHDPSSRFHLLEGFPNLSERAKAKLSEAKTSSKPEPLIIRPSAMWYERHQRPPRMDEAVRDQFGVWHVCYSIHSSREELEWALQILAPKWVVSTTPSCVAIGLDYVKRNCFASRLAPNDSLWKLFDISVETEDVPMKSDVCSQLEPEKISAPRKRHFIDLSSPPRKRPPVTLFGRARLGLQESPWREEKKEIEKNNDNDELEQEFSFKREKIAVV